jgi:hypothetical protein
METKQNNTFQALRAIDEFVDTNAALLPSVVAPAAAQPKLKAQLIELTARVALQGKSKRVASGLTQRQQELRKILLDEHMEVIRRVAAADLPHTPELKKLTVVNRTARFQNLLRDATDMAAAANPFADILVSGGLEPGFSDHLRQAAADLSAAISARATARGDMAGATKTLKTLDAAARRQIRVIDVLVKKDLKNEKALLDQWTVVRRPRKVPIASPAAAVPPVAIPPEAPAAIAAIAGQAPGVASTIA